MKVPTLLTLLIAFLSSVHVFAAGANVTGGGLDSDINSGISVGDLPPVLKGEIDNEGGRSAISLIPIEVTIADATTFNVEFTKVIGVVEILIDGVAIENCDINTIGQTTTVSVDGFKPGIYTLEFRTPQGGYVYGEFEIIEVKKNN